MKVERINRNSCPVKKDDIFFEKLDDEFFLYDPEKRRVHIVNESAEFFLGLCDGSNTLDEIEERFRESYEITPSDDISHDVIQILNSYLELHLVSVKNTKA